MPRDDWWDALYAEDDTAPAPTRSASRGPDTKPEDPAAAEDDDLHDEDDEEDPDASSEDEDTAPAAEVRRPAFDPHQLHISRIRRTLQRAVLLNTPAAAVGAWGHGAFTARWDIGIPQTVLAWMHDAAASSTSPATPLIIGALVTVGAAVVSSTVYGRLAPLIAHVDALCAVAHWLLVRVPVASCTAALLLYTTA